MSYCPQCRYEFRPEVKTCPECNRAVEEKLSLDPTSEEDYVEVYKVSCRMEAEMIQTLFDENDIFYLIRDLRVFPVLPDFGAADDLLIAVPRHAEEMARKLLEEAQTDGVLTEQGSFV